VIELTRGDAPLLVGLPHTGIDIPFGIADRLASPWLALKDTDWHVEKLYDFAASLGATVLRTPWSRTVIDVNRDPSGVSLYPGQATTELCPTTTFDGEPLYPPGEELTVEEIAERRVKYFDPYHAALRKQIGRLLTMHERVVLYDCHSIRSVIPRLFDGELPQFNIGTADGKSCDPHLTAMVEGVVADTGLSHVVNGRFKGGYITRHYGNQTDGVHVIQMELAIRGYLREPVGPVDESNWPQRYDEVFAIPMRSTLRRVLEACLEFAR
jgi:N-formylglutamate deformylase